MTMTMIMIMIIIMIIMINNDIIKSCKLITWHKPSGNRQSISCDCCTVPWVTGVYHMAVVLYLSGWCISCDCSTVPCVACVYHVTVVLCLEWLVYITWNTTQTYQSQSSILVTWHKPADQRLYHAKPIIISIPCDTY